MPKIKEYDRGFKDGLKFNNSFLFGFFTAIGIVVIVLGVLTMLVK